MRHGRAVGGRVRSAPRRELGRDVRGAVALRCAALARRGIARGVIVRGAPTFLVLATPRRAAVVAHTAAATQVVLVATQASAAPMAAAVGLAAAPTAHARLVLVAPLDFVLFVVSCPVPSLALTLTLAAAPLLLLPLARGARLAPALLAVTAAITAALFRRALLHVHVLVGVVGRATVRVRVLARIGRAKPVLHRRQLRHNIVHGSHTARAAHPFRDVRVKRQPHAQRHHIVHVVARFLRRARCRHRAVRVAQRRLLHTRALAHLHRALAQAALDVGVPLLVRRRHPRHQRLLHVPHVCQRVRAPALRPQSRALLRRGAQLRARIVHPRRAVPCLIRRLRCRRRLRRGRRQPSQQSPANRRSLPSLRRPS